MSIRAQILALLQHLQVGLGLSMLFVSHDLPVVADLRDRIFVLRGGEVVGALTQEQFLSGLAHPYTRALIADSPVLPLGCDREL